jgi:hypothetical protein
MGHKARMSRMIVGSLVAVVLVGLAGVTLVLRPWTARSSAGTPRFETEGTEIDLGILPFDGWVTATFKIRNAGDGQLVIGNAPRAKVVVGC